LAWNFWLVESEVFRDWHDGSKPVEAAVPSATLEANSEIAYKVDDQYTKWPIKAAEAVISENDRRRERFFAFVFSFRYDVR
jgi:hypothetical protein